MKFVRRVIWYLQRNSFYTFDRLLTMLRMIIGAPELWYQLYWVRGYRDIKLFNVADWHHSCRYLVAKRDGVQLFIKLGHDFLIHNEVEASKSLRSVGSRFVLEASDYRISPFFSSFVSFEFLNGYTPLDGADKFSEEKLIAIRAQLREFLQQMKSVGIIHRDIKPGNIFVATDSHDVKVIDFAMSLGPNLRPVRYALFNRFIQWDMGGDYKKPNGEWSDDYAMELVVGRL